MYTSEGVFCSRKKKRGTWIGEVNRTGEGSGSSIYWNQSPLFSSFSSGMLARGKKRRSWESVLVNAAPTAPPVAIYLSQVANPRARGPSVGIAAEVSAVGVCSILEFRFFRSPLPPNLGALRQLSAGSDPNPDETKRNVGGQSAKHTSTKQH